MVERAESPRGSRPAKSPGVLARLPLAPTLTLALVGLTLVLALIAALGIGNLYSARQDYEDTLARTYELESASSRLLAAGVIEETALVAAGPVRRAASGAGAAGLRRAAANTLRLARGDRAACAAYARGWRRSAGPGAWRRAPGDRGARRRPGGGWRGRSTAPGRERRPDRAPADAARERSRRGAR